MCKRNGHPERSSKFICLRCLRENQVGSGIPRSNTKEKDHVKDIICLCTHLEMKTKNLEVRWCDDMGERMRRAMQLKSKYYDENNELLPEWQTENMYVEREVD
ncbi:hypothetical protein DWZ63_10740 [Clostridium sp. AF34-13]|uniref:hypothetical protein n=1 Tax=Clostridium sp. AF34-13 TaxID=2293012 RepID=UPI000E557651|nr:hypothetical protein [Clostridium sp. AF34-13]RHP24422.1 hypothetical protein DWZ63_10740 [Clostridium sp. AF34-13]